MSRITYRQAAMAVAGRMDKTAAGPEQVSGNPYLPGPVAADTRLRIPYPGMNMMAGFYTDIDRTRGTYNYATNVVAPPSRIDLKNDAPFTRNLRALGSVHSGTYGNLYNQATGDTGGFAKKMRYWATVPDADWNKVFEPMPRQERAGLRGVALRHPDDRRYEASLDVPGAPADLGSRGFVYNISKYTGRSDEYYRSIASPYRGSAYGVVNIPDNAQKRLNEIAALEGKEADGTLTADAAGRLLSIRNTSGTDYREEDPAHDIFNPGIWSKWDGTYAVSPLRASERSQPEVAFHELNHASTPVFAGTDGTPLLSRNYGQGWARDDYGPYEAELYGIDPVEVVGGVMSLNTSYQALLNDMQKNPDKYPEDVRRKIQAYPAYGTKEQFMARNDMLMANPGITQKYIGPEPARALVNHSNIRGIRNHYAGQTGAWTREHETEYARLLATPARTPQQQRRLDQLDRIRSSNMWYNYWNDRVNTFNDAYFADRRAQGGTARA